ncbi:MAG TPA: hypothetical protein VJK07_01470 [Candidatus Nanoarchaeia archaeon]|nr:hypothetical protein [Candidatus Nanoarchaeia archaeon]
MKSENIILFIAAFAALSALLSAGFTYYSASSFKEGMITGLASQTNGTVNLTVDTLLSVIFTASSMNFGSGSVDAGSTHANVSSGVLAVGGSWFYPGASGFGVRNDGTVNATLNLKTGKNATQLLGGTSPAYQFKVANSEANSCLNNTGGTTAGGTGGLITLGTFFDVNTTDLGTPICGIFNFIDSADSIEIDVFFTIPYDSLQGNLTDTFSLAYCLAPGPCT